jgi:hypothetical protein
MGITREEKRQSLHEPLAEVLCHVQGWAAEISQNREK